MSMPRKYGASAVITRISASSACLVDPPGADILVLRTCLSLIRWSLRLQAPAHPHGPAFVCELLRSAPHFGCGSVRRRTLPLPTCCPDAPPTLYQEPLPGHLRRHLRQPPACMRIPADGPLSS